MDKKIMKILKMIENGTITAEQAAEQLSALHIAVPANIPPENYDQKLFRVVVDSPQGDHVNLQFPVGGVKKILKATGKIPLPEKQMPGVDLSAMMEAVSECLNAKMEGDFVNIQASDGTIVRIFVESQGYIS